MTCPKPRTCSFLVTAILASAAAAPPCRAQEQTPQEKLQELQKKQDEMQKTIDQMREELDTVKKITPVPLEAGPQSPVTYRDNMRDWQTAAARLDDLTLDPNYEGFMPVLNTPIMIRFNAHPRVDVTWQSKDANPDRFVTAQIPVTGEPEYDSRAITNLNSKGSQLSFQAIWPGAPGNPRFVYLNDFFGSGSKEYEFRVQQLYAEYYNFVFGQTFSVFEDPDVWPDTVDFEGPNAITFARYPVVQYMVGLSDHFVAKLSVEQPDSEVSPYLGEAVAGFQSLPDAGFNVRWEDHDVGHVQASSIFRYIGGESPTLGKDQVFGWGVNVCTAINLTDQDTFMGQATYGEGIGRLGNDTSFFQLDAAFDSGGDLQALAYVAAFGALTHQWSEHWRSTAVYGFVNVGNEPTQGTNAYNDTQYATLNLIYQIRRKLSIGVEVQYGTKEVNSGRDGGLLGFQLGARYSIF